MKKINLKSFLCIFFFVTILSIEAKRPDNIDQLMQQLIRRETLSKSITEIGGFNQRDRDLWVKEKIKNIEPGKKILDLGAGTCPYKESCSHCQYFSQDFMRYDGIKLDGTRNYGEIDFVCDVTDVPVEDHFFDVVICTEVLEHVLEPIKVLQEISRVLKPGGRVILTAPFACGLHQEPFHYYTGFTPYWYQHFLSKVGFEIVELSPNGGYFKMLAQECLRVLGFIEDMEFHNIKKLELTKNLFGELMPRVFNDLEDQRQFYQFSVGYHVEAVKL